MDACVWKNKFDERRQDWLIQKLKLWQIQKLYTIQADQPPFLLLDQQEDKSRLWLQDASVEDWNTFNFWVLSTELINYSCPLTAVYILKRRNRWAGAQKIISFTNQANFQKVSLWAGHLLPEMGLELGPGSAILLGGHFQIREHYLGGHFSNFMKVVQSSNKRELKLNVTSANSKHWSYKRDCR